MSNGTCEEGECSYTEMPNSEECGYVIDLCEGVECEDMCEGTTHLTNGDCFEGVCIYIEIPNSVDCGYIEEPEMELDAVLQGCIYDQVNHKFDLFFTIKNVGDVLPEYNASIWLVGPEIANRSFDIIQADYPKGQILWGEKMWGGYPWQGNVWTIRDVNLDSTIDFQLIYCNIDWNTEDCTGDVGRVLHEGNTGDLNCTS